MNSAKVKKSKSEMLREEGNEIYKSVNDKLSPVLRESRLKNATCRYEQAIYEALNDDDLSSALKNIANTQFELFKFYNHTQNEKLESYYMGESMKSIKKAIHHGSKSKSEEWVDFLLNKSVLLIQEFERTILKNDNIDKALKLNKLLSASPDHVTPYIYLIICRCYYHDSIQVLQSSYKASVNSIKECYYFFNESKRLFRNEKKLNRHQYISHLVNREILEELNDGIVIQECVSEACQQKNIADKVYDRAINESEQIDLESLWDAVDLYKSAILKSRGKDIEIEAECLSKIGTIFESVFKMKQQAKACFYKCLELAESMKPKTFTHCSWYIKCVNATKRFQKEVVDEEEKDKESKRQKVIDNIKKDIEDLNKKYEKPKMEFLKFVYEKYPPKKKENTLDPTLMSSDNFDSQKKAFKIALTHYHTDKNSEKEYGLEWFFICEEISKLLGRIYETFKSKD